MIYSSRISLEHDTRCLFGLVRSGNVELKCLAVGFVSDHLWSSFFSLGVMNLGIEFISQLPNNDQNWLKAAMSDHGLGMPRLKTRS